MCVSLYVLSECPCELPTCRRSFPTFGSSLPPLPCSRATPTLQHVLYADPSFIHANEVHLRLGLIHKVAGEFKAAYKRFQLVLNDSTECTLSRHESEYRTRVRVVMIVSWQ